MNQQTQDILITELDALKKRIADNILSTGQNASGKTIKSLNVTATETGAILEGRFPFGTLETGRKPGKVPHRFTDIIIQWMKDKSISVDPIPYKRKPSDKWQPKHNPQTRGEMAAAGAIAHKIKTKGTKLHIEGGWDAVYSKEIPVTIENIQKKLLITVSEHIKLN